MSDRRRGSDEHATSGRSPLDHASERDQLIESHLGLARHLAERYISRGEPRDDLFQVASLALVKAADRFDRSRGIEFSTYATVVVLGDLKHHLRDSAWSVRAPRRVQETYLQINGETDRLTQQLRRSPTVAELARACDLTHEEVIEALEAAQGYRAGSLEDASNGGSTLAETLSSTSEEHGATAFSEQIEGLDTTLATVLRWRFEDDLSQSEIAARLGVSQMQVSRLLRRALDELRGRLGRD